MHTWEHENTQMIAYDLVGLKYYVCRCSTFQVISNPIYFLWHYGVIFCIKLQYKSRAASEHKLKCSWLCHFSWSLLWLINASGAITSRSERPWSSFNQSVSPLISGTLCISVQGMRSSCSTPSLQWLHALLPMSPSLVSALGVSFALAPLGASCRKQLPTAGK